MKKAIFAAVFTAIFSFSAAYAAQTKESVCVINAATGEEIYSENADERRPMASTTKIMTALTALEKSAPDETVTVSAFAAAQEGSAAYIEAGDEIYMRDLLYGLMLNSGNDAAAAIAEHISGGIEEFAALMNQNAEKLGLSNTHFANPSGLDDAEHYTTARDMASLARYAMQNEEFRKIVEVKTYKAEILNSDRVLYFSNHNKMLKRYDGATGVKTGYTKSAGRCLVSSAKRDGMEFIVVTLGASDDWNKHKKLLDSAFADHYPKTVISKGEKVKTAVFGDESCSFAAAKDFIVPLKKKGGSDIDVIYHISDELRAPINAGEKVGVIEIRYGGEEIGSVDIISEQSIYSDEKIDVKNSFGEGIKRFFKQSLSI